MKFIRFNSQEHKQELRRDKILAKGDSNVMQYFQNSGRLRRDKFWVSRTHTGTAAATGSTNSVDLVNKHLCVCARVCESVYA